MNNFSTLRLWEIEPALHFTIVTHRFVIVKKNFQKHTFGKKTAVISETNVNKFQEKFEK